MANICTIQVWLKGEGSESEWSENETEAIMSDHFGPIHFVFFQFGYDWQKY